MLEIIRGPTLDRGRLDVWFNNFRDVVVIGLMTCERVVLGKVPRSPLARVHRKFVHHILEGEVDGQEEGHDDKREDGEQKKENGVVEESQKETHEDDT